MNDHEYDALLQEDEETAHLDCGCILSHLPFDDGSVSFTFCDKHRSVEDAEEPPINLNLDAMNAADLDEWRKVFKQLDEYAKWKQAAMGFRLGGQIELALDYEKHCEKLYQALPAGVRW